MHYLEPETHWALSNWSLFTTVPAVVTTIYNFFFFQEISVLFLLSSKNGHRGRLVRLMTTAFSRIHLMTDRKIGRGATRLTIARLNARLNFWVVNRGLTKRLYSPLLPNSIPGEALGRRVSNPHRPGFPFPGFAQLLRSGKVCKEPFEMFFE